MLDLVVGDFVGPRSDSSRRHCASLLGRLVVSRSIYIYISLYFYILRVRDATVLLLLLIYCLVFSRLARCISLLQVLLLVLLQLFVVIISIRWFYY